MKNCWIKYVLFIVAGAALVFSVYIFESIFYGRSYRISDYLPLNEGDVYLYAHHEGAESGDVTIRVANVEKRTEGKMFDLVWSGKYSDRVITNLLTDRGDFLVKNRHLVGEVPLKVIRKLNPPIVMIPGFFSKSFSMDTVSESRDYGGNLVEVEKIAMQTSFIGAEEIVVPAGKLKTLHFFVRHTYKDKDGNSKQMHTYDFWISSGVGIVKQIHTFTPFWYWNYIRPEDKTIMNRYSTSFVEVLELKNARIAGKQVLP